jgi:hypothetical protein
MFSRILLTAIASATLVLAQGGGDMGGGGGGMGRGGGGGGDMGGGGSPMGRAAKPSQGEQLVSKLKLNKDQTNETETILQNGLQEATPVRQQLAQARQALAGYLVDGKADEADKALKAYTDLQTQMIVVEAKSFQKIYALLKPNQTSKAGEAFDLMGGIFDPPASRGGGMGRGGMNRGGGDAGGGGSGRGRGR